MCVHQSTIHDVKIDDALFLCQDWTLHQMVNSNASVPASPYVIAFQIFKYVVYFLLVRNIYLFYVEETASSAVMHADGFSWAELINVYAATIDTASWVLLLLLFELETWVIPDNKLTPPVKVCFTFLRTACYAWIMYAVYGYFVTYLELQEWQPVAAMGANLCANVGDQFMFSLERFELITLENCNSLAISNSFLVNNENLFIDTHHYKISHMLAIADVINASDWLLIVVILEIEVWLQSQRMLKEGLLGSVQIMNIVLYAVLGLVAIFWGFYGEFIDFWDASLWIIAFIFIENNVFQWNKETRTESNTLQPKPGKLTPDD